MLSVDAVLAVIANSVVPIPAFPGSLADPQGHAGVLAQDIQTDQDSPPFDRSQLDGFAVRAADALAGASLLLAGQVDAGGTLFSDPLPPGACVGINTGAVVPPGADAILMVEHAGRESRQEQDWILVHQSVKPGQGIQRRGANARAGQTILHSGTRLGPAQLALCAAVGIAHPLVRRPRIAVLSTGDELLPVDTPLPLPAGKIRNSNQVMLCALARQASGIVLDLGTAPDEAAPMRAALEHGLAAADLLIVCGGMSMGTRDLVPLLLRDLGVELKVEKVRIKPGKPFVLGLRESAGQRHYVAGLPGNPVSAFVTFHRFVRPMLRRMEAASEEKPIVYARLEHPLPENGDREFYQPCRLRPAPDGLRAELLAWQGSADMFTLGLASGLVIQPAEAPAAPVGSSVQVLTWC